MASFPPSLSLSPLGAFQVGIREIIEKLNNLPDIKLESIRPTSPATFQAFCNLGVDPAELILPPIRSDATYYEQERHNIMVRRRTALLEKLEKERDKCAANTDKTEKKTPWDRKHHQHQRERAVPPDPVDLHTRITTVQARVEANRMDRLVNSEVLRETRTRILEDREYDRKQRTLRMTQSLTTTNVEALSSTLKKAGDRSAERQRYMESKIAEHERLLQEGENRHLERLNKHSLHAREMDAKRSATKETAMRRASDHGARVFRNMTTREAEAQRRAREYAKQRDEELKTRRSNKELKMKTAYENKLEQDRKLDEMLKEMEYRLQERCSSADGRREKIILSKSQSARSLNASLGSGRSDGKAPNWDVVEEQEEERKKRLIQMKEEIDDRLKTRVAKDKVEVKARQTRKLTHQEANYMRKEADRRKLLMERERLREVLLADMNKWMEDREKINKTLQARRDASVISAHERFLALQAENEKRRDVMYAVNGLQRRSVDPVYDEGTFMNTISAAKK